MSSLQRLEKRGIAEQAKELGWLPNDSKQRYEYPVWDRHGNVIATRTKAYDSKAAMKYGWLPSKPENSEADWYTPPGTRETIEAAGGVCYLANGEAAVLAFRAAGIYNVIATCHGENTIPKNTGETLQSFRIATLINIPDKDEAGHKAAVKWRDALLNTETNYQAKEWPDYLPEKSDANDLWIHAGFNQEAFAKALNECQALILPQPAVKAPKMADLATEETPRSLIDALVSALRAVGHKGRGEWLNGLSIFRPEEKASAGLNTKSGVYHDFGNGESYSPKEVAAKLGLTIPKQEAKPKTRKPKKVIQRESSPSLHEISEESEIAKAASSAMYSYPAYPGGLTYSWLDQDDLPLSWIKTMLHLTHGKSLVVIFVISLHYAIRRGMINPRNFTIQELMNVLGFPRKSIQNAIDTLLAWNFFRILFAISLEESPETESGKNSKVGRPETIYAINSDSDGLRLELAERMQAYLLERLTPEWELAPRMPSLRESMDLDLGVFKAWRERTRSPRHETIEATIHEWTMDILCNDSGYHFAPQDLESPLALRGKLLETLLKPYEHDVLKLDENQNPVLDDKGKPIVLRPKGLQISRADLSLLIGTSESNLGKLYAEKNVAVKRIYGWVEILNANGADIEKELREAPGKLNSSLGGIAYAIDLTVWKGGKEERLPYAAARDGSAKKLFEKWDGRIIRMGIRVEQPSLLWLMSAEEIEAKKAAKLPEIEAEEAETEDLAQGAEKGEKIAEEKPKKERKTSYIGGRDRVFRGHTPEFEREELAKEVRACTPYRLEGFALLNEANEVIYSVKALKDLVPWLNENADKKDMQKLVETASVTPVTAPKPVTPVMATPNEVTQPKAIIQAKKPAKPVIESDWKWIDHTEEFEARMKALG